MKTPLTTLTLVLGLASTTLAQDIPDLPDDQLLGAVVTATDARDEDRLLELMLEVQARELLMFKADDAVCDADVPKTGVLDNMLAYGNARQAYIVAARQAALDLGDCGCPFGLLSFGAFVRDEVGVEARDLEQGHLKKLRAFRREHQSSVDEAYRAFRTESCGKP